jgi:ribosomal protein L37AE/L43A
MSDRVSPFHCPYCGEEDLRPHGDAHGTWECRACTRVFSLRFLGLSAPAGRPAAGGRAVSR